MTPLFSVMKLWIPLFTGFVTYLLLTLLFGEYGVANYQQLQRYQGRLESHLALLENRRSALENEELLLRENEERLRIEAQSLGYVEPRQMLLRIEDAPEEDRAAWVAGSIVRRNEESPDNGSAIRAISICVTLLTLILLLGRSSKQSARARIKAEQERKEEERAYSIRRASM